MADDGFRADSIEDILAWLPDDRVHASWVDDIVGASTDTVVFEVVSTTGAADRQGWVVALAITAVAPAVRTLVGWSAKDEEWQVIEQQRFAGVGGDVDAEVLAERLRAEERAAFETWGEVHYPDADHGPATRE